VGTENSECAGKARVLARDAVVFPDVLTLVQSIISVLACRILAPGGSGTKLRGKQRLLDLIVPKARIRTVRISAQPR